MALSCNPIPPDPGYEGSRLKSEGYDSLPRSRERIRPEATSIALMHQKGSLESLFSSNPSTPRTRIKYASQKNHCKENRKRIQQLEAQSKKREEAQKRVSLPYKSKKYAQIPPKVTVFMQDPCSPRSPRTRTPGCCKLNPKADSEELHHECNHSSHVTDGGIALKSKKNFVAINITNAAKMCAKEPPNITRLTSLSEKCERAQANYKRGTVPQYLQKRKREWHMAEQHRIASLPDPSVPRGYTVMPENERISTLSILQKNLSTLSAELQLLPLHSDTLRVQNRKMQLEQKLSEIEDAIKTFSKPRVFIKVE